MAIRFHEKDAAKQKFLRRKIKKWIEGEILRKGKNPGEINIIFTSDDSVRVLNREYLKKNYYTDILSFDYSKEFTINGDLFISVERVNENAINYHTRYEQELFRVIIHGILHLLGFDDKTEKDKIEMRNEEDKCLERLNF